ncbi:MAG: DUF1501 domain-containing protein [Planctomycetaceae bacterium]
MKPPQPPAAPLLPRRALVAPAGGLVAAALVGLGIDGRAAAAPAAGPRPRARRAIQVCFVGGLSQVDSFDHKPELDRLHGRPLPDGMKPETFFGGAGLLRRGDWTFRRRGESGLWVSDLFPALAGVADELTVIRSMTADTANHMPALFQENTGFRTNGFPALGSWLSYGLGAESDALPTFVVLPDGRSQPNGGAANWSNGFLPASHQGVPFHSATEPVRDLFPARAVGADEERDGRGLVSLLDRVHLGRHPGDDLLAARIRAAELAARMQVSVPEALDFADEPQRVLDAYGVGREPTDDAARRCLLARRLLERGVRFVQLYSGGAFGGTPRHGWDGHEDNRENHAREAALVDRPLAALLGDLKARGLLDETVLLFTTEFGRTPFTQSAPDVLGAGRDHNPEGFTVWMAGAGLRPGVAHGATDEVGWRAVEEPVTWPDLHATLLHILGIDHERLTFYHDGIGRRLTNVSGRPIDAILA